MEQRIETVDITPQLARKWLETNHDNRNLRPIKITQYARDMAAGRWQFTGEAIKFDSKGELIDGQNRLHAVIKADVTISMLVIGGLDRSTQTVMDSGAARNVRDALAFRGYASTKTVAAVANAHLAWTTGRYPHCMVQLGGADRPSTSELLEYVELNPVIVDASRRAEAMYNRGFRVPQGAIGAAWIELMKVDADDCFTYFERIATLETTGEGDPISTLIRRVNDMRVRQTKFYPSTALFMIFRSWNAVRAGERLQKLQFGSLGSFVAIPAPK